MRGWIRGWSMTEDGQTDRRTDGRTGTPWGGPGAEARTGARPASRSRRPRRAAVCRAALAVMLAGLSVVPCFRPSILSAQSLARRLDARLDAPPMDRYLWGV